MSEYLAINKIKGDYSSLREKWTTFQELNTRVVSKLDDPKTLATHKINGNETGHKRTKIDSGETSRFRKRNC